MADNNILVIDDSHVISSLLDDFLTEKGFRVSLAGTAEDAFVKIKERLPDLIVLDLVLPDVHGLQFCRVLKSDPQTRHIPVIMVTAKAIDVKDKVEGLRVGADDYLTKPFELSEFYERVNAVLRRVELDRERVRETPGPSEETQTVDDEQSREPEWPAFKGWQKLVSLMTEPGWFFSWVLKGPSQNKEMGFSAILASLIPALGAFSRLLRAGPRLGKETLNGVVQVIVFLAGWLVLSGVLQVVSSLTGRKTAFKAMSTILGLSLAPLLLARILELVYIFAGGRPGEFSSDMSLFFPHLSTRSLAGFLLRRVDVFEIWSLVLAGIGLSSLWEASPKRSFIVVSCLWLTLVAVGVLIVRVFVLHH